MVLFLRRFLGQAALGLGLALLLLLLPLPAGGLWAALQLAVGVVLLVCALGKALYDTLFYDHYWP